MSDPSNRDIVARLRDSQPEGTKEGYLLNDAAAEIERLREELAMVRRILDGEYALDASMLANEQKDQP